MENAACVLRNLSYRLENEVDPQEETGDVLDHDWEEEQQKDMDEIMQPFSNSSPGCLAFLKRSRGSSRREREGVSIVPCSADRPTVWTTPILVSVGVQYMHGQLNQV